MISWVLNKMAKFLTEHEIKIRDNIRTYKLAIRRYRRKISTKCKHTCIILEKEVPDYVGMTINWGDAICAICNENYGWYCEKSPTHACSYEQPDGTIIEYCSYCGEPYERK
jgi:hypothetical protein